MVIAIREDVKIFSLTIILSLLKFFLLLEQHNTNNTYMYISYKYFLAEIGHCILKITTREACDNLIM